MKVVFISVIFLLFYSCVPETAVEKSCLNEKDGVCAGGGTSPKEDTKTNSAPAEASTADMYTLTISSPIGGRIYTSDFAIDCGHGDISKNKCSIELNEGQTIQLLTQSREGYKFKNWEGACGINSECTLSLTSNLSVSGSFGSLPITPVGNLLFYDSFESGDMSTTNSDGFSWARNNRTSIVFGDGSINKVIWNNGIRDIPINDGRDWTPKNGTNSLRFRYAASEAMTEQRFDLGTPQTEVWYSYWTRVPANYRHTTTGGGVNNKFFSMWTDGYEGSGTGSTFWLSMESAGAGNTNLAFTFTTGNNTGSVSMQQHTPFIDYQTDRNRWMKIVIHLKAESSENANDGVVETWRRWSDEDTFTKFHEKFDAPLRLPPGGPNGFKEGYLFGWANGEYIENTEWLLDDFKVSSTSLLGDDVVTENPSPPVVDFSESLFWDSFESGNISSAPLNNINFRFHDNVATSLVTGGPGEKSVIYPTVIPVNDDRDWTAFYGENSMRFRYAPGRAMTEIKASWDSQPVLWMKYMVRVPKNYYHSSSGPGNNKFMALWQDTYEFNGSGKGATITTQLRSSGGGSANISFYHIKSIDPQNASSYRLGGDQQQSGIFISVPSDRGRWMTIVYKLVPSSSYLAHDGSMEMWRKWEGESEYVKYFDYKNVDKLNAPSNMTNGFAHGYFQGWANSQYTEVTEWLYDNFEISKESLL